MGVEVKPMIAIEFQSATYVSFESAGGGVFHDWRNPANVRVELSIEDTRQLWNELGRKIREFNKEQEA